MVFSGNRVGGKGEFVTNCGYIRENVTRVKFYSFERPGAKGRSPIGR
jgi:hypothetical protein